MTLVVSPKARRLRERKARTLDNNDTFAEQKETRVVIAEEERKSSSGALGEEEVPLRPALSARDKNSRKLIW